MLPHQGQAKIVSKCLDLIVYEDTDYEEESRSDVELEDKKKQKQRKESVDVLMDSMREMTLTRRQRALLSSKDASGSGASLLKFPNGLPPAPPRKQKEKLSEMELQLKKAEAAHCAEAIRKILGQNSSRKKREEKMKKRQELAQEKAANAQMFASNTIRYVMGPTRSTVTPSILNSKPISYPPPPKKCAGPSYTSAYKYRDLKSKLPLCSVECCRLYMRRWQLKLPLPLPLDVTNDPPSLAMPMEPLMVFLSRPFGRDLILKIVHLLYYTF